MFQEKHSTGEVSCRTEDPLAAQLSTEAAEGEDEAVCPYPVGATCTPEAAEEAAGAAPGPLRTSVPVRRGAEPERTASPTEQLTSLCFKPKSVSIYKLSIKKISSNSSRENTNIVLLSTAFGPSLFTKSQARCRVKFRESDPVKMYNNIKPQMMRILIRDQIIPAK